MGVITIPKRLSMMKDRGFHFLYDDKWLSDGKFLIAQPMVKNVFDFIGNPRGKSDFNFNRIVPNISDCKLFNRTNLLYNNGNGLEVRLYRADDGEFACYSEEFLQVFQLREMWAKSATDPACNQAQTIILMPCRVGAFIEEIKTLTFS